MKYFKWIFTRWYFWALLVYVLIANITYPDVEPINDLGGLLGAILGTLAFAFVPTSIVYVIKFKVFKKKESH